MNKNRRNDHDVRNYSNIRGNKNNYHGLEKTTYPFEINQKVRHIATGVELIVIKYGREQIECRKPDLTAEYFYLYELEEII